MEDTQRSQPISPERQGIVEQAACTSSQVAKDPNSPQVLLKLLRGSKAMRQSVSTDWSLIW